MTSVVMKDRHVIEALGRTKVVIEDGKVVSVEQPEVGYCPLFHKVRGYKELNSEIVRENMEYRMRTFGMCLPSRELRMHDFLSYGISELLGMAIAKKMLDCAVLVCDGAGTVVVDDPELVQGIGGRISGMIETTPILEIVEGIGRDRVLDPERGRIDQFAGVEKAFKMGYRAVAVTVAKAQTAQMIRDAFGANVFICAVHTTGADQRDAIMFLETCDIVTGCASRWVREEAKARALLQAGTKVPVYATSALGKKVLEERFAQVGKPKQATEDPPRPLV